MPEYRRLRVEGGTFFFTVVTYERRHFLTDELARICLRHALETARKRAEFAMPAMVLMPDHLHCLMQLPPENSDYSTRWSHIKGEFSRLYLASGGEEGRRCGSRAKKGEAAVWHRRFWEHAIRDETDLTRHMDYIHYNPVKHGYTQTANEWPWSSFHRYVRLGWYDDDWGSAESDGLNDMFERLE